MCSIFSMTALGLDCLLVPCSVAIGAINGRETEILTTGASEAAAWQVLCLVSSNSPVKFLFYSRITFQVQRRPNTRLSSSFSKESKVLENVGVVLQSPSLGRTETTQEECFRGRAAGHGTWESDEQVWSQPAKDRKVKRRRKENGAEEEGHRRRGWRRGEERERCLLLFQKSLGPSHKCVSEGNRSNFQSYSSWSYVLFFFPS